MPNEEHIPLKNTSIRVQPHIYHSNPHEEKEWKDTLHKASLSLASTLTRHYAKVIRTEQEKLDEIRKEITEHLSQLQGKTRESYN